MPEVAHFIFCWMEKSSVTPHRMFFCKVHLSIPGSILKWKFAQQAGPQRKWIDPQREWTHVEIYYGAPPFTVHQDQYPCQPKIQRPHYLSLYLLEVCWNKKISINPFHWYMRKSMQSRNQGVKDHFHRLLKQKPVMLYLPSINVTMNGIFRWR